MGEEAAGTDMFAASSTKQPHRTHRSEDTEKALQCPFSSGQPEHTFDHADAGYLSPLSLNTEKDGLLATVRFSCLLGAQCSESYHRWKSG